MHYLVNMNHKEAYVKRISRFFSEPKHHNVMLDLNPLSEWTSIIKSLGISVSFIYYANRWLTEVYLNRDIYFLVKPEVKLHKEDGYVGAIYQIDLQNLTLYEFVSQFLYEPLYYLQFASELFDNYLETLHNGDLEDTES